MPPKMSEMHRDRVLENISFGYKNDGLIADALIPMVSVVRESDVYYVYTKDHLRLPQSRRANRAESNQGGWHASTGSYLLNEEALHDYISDRDRRNVDKPLSLDVDTTEALTEQIQIRKEFDLCSLMTTTSWANSASLTSTLSWVSTNATATNPIPQIDSCASVIKQNAMKKPNRLAMNDAVFNATKEHVSVLDRIKYTSPDSVTPAMLAKLFNVEQLLVGYGVYNTGGSGLADSMSFLWPNACFLAYMEPNPGLKKISAMYRFTQAESGNPWQVKKWREEKRGSDAVEVSTMYQFKPVCTDAAYLLKL